MNSAQNLRSERRRLSMSQRQLADRAGLSQGTIAHAECGLPPSRGSQRAIAEALGVEPSAIWTPWPTEARI